MTVMQECGNSVRLIDVADTLPGLQYSRGLHTCE